MKVLGIITEYNPFHKGHKYHIEEAKRITGADYVIAVMSGDFVQRGTPAITSKYDRSLMALYNGVDMVFELPVCYATGSAQYFALGAVSLLNGLGIVDYLCFGSECGDIELLKEAAQLLNSPSESFQSLLYSYIKDGISYPAARALAAEQTLLSENKDKSSQLLEAISEPNNILGIEYINALKQIESTIIPVTIRRHKAHYHDKYINHDNDKNNSKANNDYSDGISSATAIRAILENTKISSDLNLVKGSVPKNVYEYFIRKHYTTYPITIEDFAAIIKYKLLSESSRELATYLDLSSDIADRIKNIDMIDLSLEELSQSIKTKNITLTRVNRSLIHVLLNIKKEAFQEYIDDKIIYYARILGMKKEASHLIRKIKKHERLPIITKVSSAYKQLDPLGLQMLNQDIFASHLYNQIIYDKFKTTIVNEYKHGICLI